MTDDMTDAELAMSYARKARLGLEPNLFADRDLPTPDGTAVPESTTPPVEPGQFDTPADLFAAVCCGEVAVPQGGLDPLAAFVVRLEDIVSHDLVGLEIPGSVSLRGVTFRDCDLRAADFGSESEPSDTVVVQDSLMRGARVSTRRFVAENVSFPHGTLHVGVNDPDLPEERHKVDAHLTRCDLRGTTISGEAFLHSSTFTIVQCDLRGATLWIDPRQKLEPDGSVVVSQHELQHELAGRGRMADSIWDNTTKADPAAREWFETMSVPYGEGAWILQPSSPPGQPGQPGQPDRGRARKSRRQRRRSR